MNNIKPPTFLKNQEFKCITKLSFNSGCGNNDKIGDQGINLIVQAELPLITDLELRDNDITDRGISKMRKCKWKYIELIILDNNPIKNVGVKELVRNKWKSLKYLCLSNIGLTDDGAKILTKGQWPKLQQLGLMWNHLTHQVCNHLIHANWVLFTMISWMSPGNGQFKIAQNEDITKLKIRNKKCNCRRRKSINLKRNIVIRKMVHSLLF